MFSKQVAKMANQAKVLAKNTFFQVGWGLNGWECVSMVDVFC